MARRTHKARKRISSHRRSRRTLRGVVFEGLEDRRLLMGDWYNAFLPNDVNADGLVSAWDALRVINSIANEGSRPVPAVDDVAQVEAFYDTSNDDYVSSIDALRVINELLSDTPALNEAEAISNHYMVATFEEPITEELLDPAKYLLTDPNKQRLEVTSVAEGESPNQVILTTASQQPVDYAVAMDGSSVSPQTKPISGSTGAEPYLVSAVATSSQSVTLTFSDALAATSAELPGFYRIVATNGETPPRDVGYLSVVSASLSPDRMSVALTTTPMENFEYHVFASSSIISSSGSKFLDPTRNSTSFFGLPHSNGLSLTNAVAPDPRTIVLNFSERLNPNTLDEGDFSATYGIANETLVITEFELDETGKQVTLRTFPQPAGVSVTVTASQLQDIAGNQIAASQSSVTFVTPVFQTPTAEELPRVVGAEAVDNQTVLVAFSHPMGPSALAAASYVIVQENENPEAGALLVTAAEYLSPNNRSTIKLTTVSQSEVTYTLQPVNVLDETGRPLASPIVSDGVLFDPTRASFPGAPYAGDTILDTDGDGLADNYEQRGWIARFVLSDGTVVERGVTSNPYVADTDGDGFSDAAEAALRLDPRDVDTDDDLLEDDYEFFVLYTDPANQDSDGDSLKDGRELNIFFTSPVHADTDGDQIADFDEIIGNRNPRVADLPRPEIGVGAIDLQLDVKFTESNSELRRDLETRAITTTLNKSDIETHTRQHTANVEAHFGFEYSSGLGNGRKGVFGDVTAGYTFQSTDESVSETQRQYQRSLNSESEVTRGFNLERRVEGALMRVAVSLRNASDLSYRVKNLQVTAFIQDPLDHSQLTPVATLLPDNEPEEGYTLGPLVTNRGPFIFTNDTIVPTLVESLMANPTGLIFRIANYDIIDETGRNFAFTSQEVVERTSSLIIDFGGASSLAAQLSGAPLDETQPGDETEIARVATSAGRPVADTNGDGIIDLWPRELYDANGNSLGVDINGDGRISDADVAVIGTAQAANAATLQLEAGESFLDDIGYTRRYQVRITAGPGAGQVRTVTAYSAANQTVTVDQVWTVTPTSASEYSITYVPDTRIVFDEDRLEVGVSLHQALTAAGLTRYDEDTTPTANLTDDQILNSYSTRVSNNREEIFRIRGVANDLINQRFWEILTPLGVDANSRLDDLILTNDLPISLNFVQDLDGDGLTADVEFVLGTSDSPDTSIAGGTAQAGANTTIQLADAETFADDELNDFVVEIIAGSGAGQERTIVGYDGATDTATVGSAWNVAPGSDSIYQISRKTGAAQGGDASTIQFDAAESFAAMGYTVEIVSGAGLNQKRIITAYDETTKTATVTPDWSTPPDSTSQYEITQPPKGRDTDGDMLDDRFEALIGWKVTTPQGSYQVYPSPKRADSNFDGPIPSNPLYDGSDLFAAPAGWDDANGNGLRDRFNEVFQLTRQQNGNAPDYVLDPLGRDSDDDGIDDADEVIGFKIIRITGNSEITRQTDPVNPDTDRDTLLDGFERSVGLDPTDGNDIDTDGDGLPDPVEMAGWQVTTEAVSTTPNQPGVSTAVTRMSRINDTDSDDDGLSDLEEFFLRSNPISADTDGDGIDDLTETRGFDLRDLGIITTDPLDADVDNDKRSDGAEAELQEIEANRWVVRVDGEEPRRVFSNPLVADADFDLLVDGDEFALPSRTDPNNSDTDRDGRDDKLETEDATLNPLKKEIFETFRVTVVYVDLKIDKDGDEGGAGPGDIGFDLGVRLPQDSGVAGLSDSLTSVIRQDLRQTSTFRSEPTGGPRNVEDLLERCQSQTSLCNNGVETYGIPMTDGETLQFVGLLSDAARSVSFNMTPDQAFSVEGALMELDGAASGAISNATRNPAIKPEDSSPVMITTTLNHGLKDGERIVIRGVNQTDANGEFEIDVLSANTFTLKGTTHTQDGVQTGASWKLEALTRVFYGGLEGVGYSFTRTVGEDTETRKQRAVFSGEDLLAGPPIIDLNFVFNVGDNVEGRSGSGEIEGEVNAYIVVQPLV